MKYNPEIHNRKSVRLKNYDYSRQGMYFITICIKNKEKILSIITNHYNIELQNIGKIVQKYIKNINIIYINVR